jgi:CRP-like cAMP-binding protein
LTEAFDASPLIRKLETILVLSDDEKNALQSIGGTVKTLDARQDIVREGDRPSACCLLLEGFLCRYKLTHDGKRQIISFHIPGEIPDLQSLHLDVMDHSMGTLAQSKTGIP